MNRQSGYLYWLAWVIENSNSVFSTSDAEGPFRRAVFEMSCNSIHAILDQTNGAADALYGPLSSVLTEPEVLRGAEQV